MKSDPFAELGLTSEASDAEIREARRRLAKQHHPDIGGDAARMGSVNAAAADALRSAAAHSEQVNHPADPAQTENHPAAPHQPGGDWSAVSRDVPSFTVEALPVETFEALVVVGAGLGELVDDDPPYRLDVALQAPLRCWCRLDVVPDAGASTVSLSIGSFDDLVPPPIDVIRDVWIEALNALDWPEVP
ncbi:MAG: J domain-containing protein [Acidimicrobiia bacterium]|nr:J domain-containing protein [Acidimicrobiia bacterium]